jgi:hypothetical protein
MNLGSLGSKPGSKIHMCKRHYMPNWHWVIIFLSGYDSKVVELQVLAWNGRSKPGSKIHMCKRHYMPNWHWVIIFSSGYDSKVVELQVLAWNGHKNVAELNLLMLTSQPSPMLMLTSQPSPLIMLFTFVQLDQLFVLVF